MARSIRLFDLIQALRRRRRPVSAVTLAKELGVSKRTIYRDIETLIAVGAPVVGEAGIGYVLRPGFMLPPLMFTEDELESLVLGGQWVKLHADHDLVLAAQNALAKISAVLPTPLTTNLENPALLPAPAPAGIAERFDPAILRRAVRNERKLRIAYVDDAGNQSERIVWPIALVYFEAVRILVAWCETREAFRHFRTDRISTVIEMNIRYPKRRFALLNAWREIDAASGRKPVERTLLPETDTRFT
jgi:predicted DNA-binding transcriptional regulator YafY